MNKDRNVILISVSRLLIPFIQLYALYVIVHGDSGPGGGFQGGVILGASVILYAIVFGFREARGRVRQRVNDVLNSVGVLIYGGVGLAALFFGGMYLQYGHLPFPNLHLASHYGIFFIEIGVGITVAAVMMTIFFETADRSGDEGEQSDPGDIDDD
jgi:multicomponent Na+:H+ antiporter subunit B